MWWHTIKDKQKQQLKTQDIIIDALKIQSDRIAKERKEAMLREQINSTPYLEECEMALDIFKEIFNKKNHRRIELDFRTKWLEDKAKDPYPVLCFEDTTDNHSYIHLYNNTALLFLNRDDYYIQSDYNSNHNIFRLKFNMRFDELEEYKTRSKGKHYMDIYTFNFEKYMELYKIYNQYNNSVNDYFFNGIKPNEVETYFINKKKTEEQLFLNIKQHKIYQQIQTIALCFLEVFNNIKL